MLARISTGAVVGLSALPIDTEVNISKKGFGSFKIVGLASRAVDEARHRVKAAIENSKLFFPKYKITVNLAPADLPKDSPAYDLPIALGIILAAGLAPKQPEITRSLVIGELSLDGTLRSTSGVLPLALLAKERGFRQIFVPAINSKEANIVEGIKVMPVSSLLDLLSHLNGLHPILPLQAPAVNPLSVPTDYDYDFSDVRGQDFAKRALEIAAAGGHNVHLSGPPGAGKTLLARTLPSIMPPLTIDEALEVTKVHSITHSLDPSNPLITQRPFRAPHHTTSRIGLIGGGQKISPGEVSMSHRGILFLDEFPEFPRSVLESLRQPMEDGAVTISRAQGSLTFPSRFMLVAASNPCPCGYYGSSKKRCTCTAAKRHWYERRVSGPMMDRIDIHVDVPEVEVEKLVYKEAQTKREQRQSAVIREKVTRAREIQQSRFRTEPIGINAEMTSRHILKYYRLTRQQEEFLTQAIRQHNLSARGYHKVLKVARTIADLEESAELQTTHLAEALQFRFAHKSI